jgi:uncharacterized protein YbjT (DUF2867 family)
MRLYGQATMTLLLAAASRSPTGQLVAGIARRRGHHVRWLDALDDPGTVADAVRDARAIVLIPKRGDAERHAHAAVGTLAVAARRLVPAAHLVLVSSFAVGHGPAHPFNRVTASLPGRLAAEQALRASGLPWTVARPTWLTDDPPGAHAVSVTQDPRADGMLARADLAAALVAAAEHPLARGKTFALFNEPGRPADDWASVFAGLAPDAEAVAT